MCMSHAHWKIQTCMHRKLHVLTSESEFKNKCTPGVSKKKKKKKKVQCSKLTTMSRMVQLFNNAKF